MRLIRLIYLSTSSYEAYHPKEYFLSNLCRTYVFSLHQNYMFKFIAEALFSHIRFAASSSGGARAPIDNILCDVAIEVKRAIVEIFRSMMFRFRRIAAVHS